MSELTQHTTSGNSKELNEGQKALVTTAAIHIGQANKYRRKLWQNMLSDDYDPERAKALAANIVSEEEAARRDRAASHSVAEADIVGAAAIEFRKRQKTLTTNAVIHEDQVDKYRRKLWQNRLSDDYDPERAKILAQEMLSESQAALRDHAASHNVVAEAKQHLSEHPEGYEGPGTPDVTDHRVSNIQTDQEAHIEHPVEQVR